ncbi:hypothetical protein [Siccirubricoccus phaeus]|uniref:hypothetical protein n=1 Tax=Siccirubricoccus phaeus TaxID=2595053 RepID=UPI0011F0F8D9|nr:hypothetical protein [Siccirubricoccus phaeus]
MPGAVAVKPGGAPHARSAGRIGGGALTRIVRRQRLAAAGPGAGIAISRHSSQAEGAAAPAAEAATARGIAAPATPL